MKWTVDSVGGKLLATVISIKCHFVRCQTGTFLSFLFFSGTWSYQFQVRAQIARLAIKTRPYFLCLPLHVASAVGLTAANHQQLWAGMNVRIACGSSVARVSVWHSDSSIIVSLLCQRTPISIALTENKRPIETPHKPKDSLSTIARKPGTVGFVLLSGITFAKCNII